MPISQSGWGCSSGDTVTAELVLARAELSVQQIGMAVQAASTAYANAAGPTSHIAAGLLQAGGDHVPAATQAAPVQQVLPHHSNSYKQQMLELLQILVDMRSGSQENTAELDTAIGQTDTALQTGMRALSLANHVLATGGSTWVADRALLAAEINMTSAIQRLHCIQNMAGQVLQARLAVQQHQQYNDLAAAAAANRAVHQLEDCDEELRDTCSSILREFTNPN